MTPGQRAIWRRVVTQAASPDERADQSCFRPAQQDPSTVDSRSQRRLGRYQTWLDNVSPRDPDGFHRVLAARGLDQPAIEARLADVRLIRQAHLPLWAQELEALIEGCTGAVVGQPPLEPGSELRWPLRRAFDAIDRLSAEWLRATIEQLGASVAPEAARELLDAQLLRLHRVSLRCLSSSSDERSTMASSDQAQESEEGASRTLLDIAFPTGASIVDGWLHALARYPGLARVLGDVIHQWHATTAEFLERLSRDRELIERRFTRGDPLGPLSGCSVSGDVHEGGRGVALLTFAGGTRIVYKPKDVRIAAAFLDLVHTLNERELPLALHTHKIIAGRDYAWEEFVAETPCENAGQVGRFYFRCGMLLRLLQSLRGSDFHYENIIAAGEQPVPIDLEMLMQPDLSGRIEQSLQAAAIDEHARSPLSVGMLPWKTLGEPGRRAADVGVLVTGEQQQAPYKTILPVLDGDGQIHAGWYYPTLGDWHCLPQLNGDRIGVLDYVDDVIAGYRAMAACLHRHSAWLSSPDGPVATMAALPARVVMRSSSVYARMIEESYAPEQLRSGIDRDLRLERLWRAYAGAPQTAPVIAAEVDQLRSGVIPTFTSLPSGNLLFSAQTSGIPAIIARPALSGVLARLGSPDDRSVDRDVDVIGSALATITAAPRPWKRSPAQVSAGAPATQESWLDHATAIGDFLLAEAMVAADGTRGWYGLSYTPWADALRLSALDAGLLGAGGIALVLADLAAATGGSRFHEAAQAVLTGIVAELQKAHLPPAPAFIYCGPFFGPLAGIYPLLRAAERLAEPSLARAALDGLMAIDWDALISRSPVDLISGRAGLLLALLRAAAAPVEAWGGLLAKSLIDDRSPDGGYPLPPYPTGMQTLDGLPGTNAGAALALGRWRCSEPNTGELSSATPAPIGAAGFPPETVAVAPTVGDLLAHVAMPAPTVDEAQAINSLLAHHLDGVLAGDVAETPTAALLDSLDLAVTAYQANCGPRFRRDAALLAGELVQRRKRSGKWFPDYLAADRHNLSAVSGVAAIAHALLRLDDVTIPSLRLLG